jgi:membrane protein
MRCVSFWRQLDTWFQTSDRRIAIWLRAARSALLGEMTVLAAGTALYAIIATVPALAAAVSVFGIVANASDIQSHLQGLSTVMPEQVVGFLGSQLQRQAQRTSGELSFQLIIGLVAATISARSSARALIDSLNRAYRIKETRGKLVKFAFTILMAMLTIVGLMVMFAIIVALPAVVAAAGLKGYGLVRLLRWPLMLGLVLASLGLMYRFAPSPRPLQKRHIWPGAGIATVLLVVVSWVLSLWVDHVATYEVFYGAFGSVIILILWFYLSTIALIVGGFVNAELERGAGAPEPDRHMY